MKSKFEALINKGITNQCSDIHIDLLKKTRIAMRHQGKIKAEEQIPLKEGKRLFNYILFKANMDILNRNHVNSGMIEYQYGDKEVYLRISVIPTLDCDSIVIRILNNHPNIPLNKLSLFTNHHDILKDISELNNGLVIFTGKTGSGKTTTLYALLEAMYHKTKKKIITLEDPIERKIEGLLQIFVNREITSFFDVLKQVLRHDPDIIVIGEIRDAQDLKLAIQAALSGHLVLTSMHSINALFAINRLLELGVSHSDLKATIKYLSYQELYYQEDQVFTLYEFIDNNNILTYLDTQECSYLQIKDYLKHLDNYHLVRGK